MTNELEIAYIQCSSPLFCSLYQAFHVLFLNAINNTRLVVERELYFVVVVDLGGIC